MKIRVKVRKIKGKKTEKNGEEKEKGESRRVNFGLECKRECNEEINEE